MLCVKNTHGGVLLLVACNFTKSSTSPWVFSRFKLSDATKSCKESQKNPNQLQNYADLV